ncbi:AraC family transcriptional regulator [Paraburkholderia edwinii]|uniref:AraC family transcriptional regulator n=1 Tax=Paraburkholderia edwinii TaxID=2861782 RepID=A0ABX8UL24_9BURK|nr:AraC family transcriptional regulator [Paraburkholderia edwinii]QYD69037.1 AraC family transcriptional regulator [Paraburkholderia edwinii]
MIDRLSSLLNRFELRARVFRGGGLSGTESFEGGGEECHLHLVRGGSMVLTSTTLGRHVIVTPGAVFLRHPRSYRLDSGEGDTAEVISAAFELGLGDENPLLRSLPGILSIPFTCVPSLEAVQEALFAEYDARACGYAAVVDRLAEVLVIQLLRFAIRRQLVESGSLAGLADTRLAKALTAMHADPSQEWTLELMARMAGMSRSRFAAAFTDTVGMPPGEYLAQWRIGLAKRLLRRGFALKLVALEVGYGSASALTRAFTHGVGLTPTQWLAGQRELLADSQVG